MSKRPQQEPRMTWRWLCAIGMHSWSRWFVVGELRIRQVRECRRCGYNEERGI